jgi:flagellar motility protein MotE (MotC chaperone)
MAKAKKTKEKKPKDKRNYKIWRILLVIIIAVALTLGIGIAFNLGGMGVKTNNFLAGIPIANSFIKPVQQAKTAEELKKESQESAMKMLEQERTNLEELSDNLAAWELQLKAKEEELMEQKEAVAELQQRLDTRLHNIEELVSYYESMDASDAVNILNNISDNELIIVILKNMKQQKCSEILAAMEPRKAARLIEIMSVM